MGLTPIALGRTHLMQDMYLRIIYRRKESFVYGILQINTKLYFKNQKNIHLTNMVKKHCHHAISKGCELEPKHSEQFIIQATLVLLDKEVPIRLLVDSGALGPILHEDFVRKNGLLVKKRKMPKQVKNANEEPIPNAGPHYTQPT